MNFCLLIHSFIAWPGQVDCVMDMFAADGKLKRKQFEPAMAELDRRVCLEHGLYWDYQSISQYSDRKELRLKKNMIDHHAA